MSPVARAGDKLSICTASQLIDSQWALHDGIAKPADVGAMLRCAAGHVPSVQPTYTQGFLN